MCNYNMANKKEKERKEYGMQKANNVLLRKILPEEKKIDHDWFMLQKKFLKA